VRTPGGKQKKTTRLTTGKSQLFFKNFDAKTRKREKTGENGSLSVEFRKNQKILQKPVDRYRLVVYNKRACLTGVFRLP